MRKQRSGNAEAVSAWRRRTKVKLVESAGGKCIDCSYIGPAFMYDFDHRDPEQKSFSIGGKGHTRKFDFLLEEIEKCDLVCANCHRMRTHKQRCSGCEDCL